jgi:hypothetical protein
MRNESGIAIGTVDIRHCDVEGGTLRGFVLERVFDDFFGDFLEEERIRRAEWLFFKEMVQHTDGVPLFQMICHGVRGVLPGEFHSVHCDRTSGFAAIMIPPVA